MALWSTRPVENQPALTLSEWRVMELLDGERHLVEFCMENRRKSKSPVIELKQDSLRTTTTAGRLYFLGGVPGHNADAMYVWSQWT